MPSPSFDAAQFRATLGRFATGVTIITTEAADGSPVGLTVSSFNSVSLDPPLVLWSLAQSSSSIPAMQQCERYVIHVLSAGQIALVLVTIIVGIIFCAAGIEGYFRRALPLLPRTIIGLGGTVLVFGHNLISIIAGVVVTAAGLAISQWMAKPVPAVGRAG